jgi:hypothetical protein
MANLTYDSPRSYLAGAYEVIDLPVAAGVWLYQGMATSNAQTSAADTGYIQPLVASQDFTGFCFVQTNNTSGTAGAVTSSTVVEGYIFLSVTGVSSAASLGASVYASDSNTFTTTSSGNSYIGKVVRWISGSNVLVKFVSVANKV